MTIYMRNEDRHSYERLRIPVARYMRHHIRGFALYLHEPLYYSAMPIL